MTLVIAYGNPLRGDDGVAWTIAERLQRTALGMTVLTRQQLVPELAEAIADAFTVIFVDARYGDPPGHVRCARLRRRESGPVLGHMQTPEALLALAGDLFGHEPDAYLVSVGVARIGFGSDLSPDVASAVPHACELIVTLARLSATACRLKRRIAQESQRRAS